MSTLTLALEVVTMAEGETLGSISCSHCQEPLSLHQPDSDAADLFLGVCEDCKGWFMIDAERGLILQLPRMADLTLPTS